MNKTAEKLYQEHLYLLEKEEFIEQIDGHMAFAESFTVSETEAKNLFRKNMENALRMAAEKYHPQDESSTFSGYASWYLKRALRRTFAAICPIKLHSNCGKINHCYSVLKAAQNNEWEKADNILAEKNVNMSSARFCDGPNVISALAMALEAGEFEIAKKLYDAGDRLDDYHREDTEGGTVGAVLSFLAMMHSKGYNFFQDDSLTFAECCKKGLLIQAEKLLPDVSQSELDRALKAVVQNFYTLCCRFTGEKVVEFLNNIIAHGGNAVLVYPDLCLMLDNLKKLPASLQMDESVIESMEKFRADIQEKINEISDK